MADVSKLFDLNDSNGPDPIDKNEVNFVRDYDDDDYNSDKDGDYLPPVSVKTESSSGSWSPVKSFTDSDPSSPPKLTGISSPSLEWKTPRHRRPSSSNVSYSSNSHSPKKPCFADSLVVPPSRAPDRHSGAPWKLWISSLLFFTLVTYFLNHIPQSPIPATQDFYVHFPAALHKARLLSLQPYHIRQRAKILASLRVTLAGNLGFELPEHNPRTPEPNSDLGVASHNDIEIEDEGVNMAEDVNKCLNEYEDDIFKLMELFASTSRTTASSIIILYRTLASSAAEIGTYSAEMTAELAPLAAWDKYYPWRAKYWEILDAVGIRETHDGEWKWRWGLLDAAFDGREEARRTREWKKRMREMRGEVERLLKVAKWVETELEVLGKANLTLARRLDAEWERAVNGQETGKQLNSGKREGLHAVKEWAKNRIGVSDMKRQDTLKNLMTVGKVLGGTVDVKGIKGLVKDLERCVEVLEEQLMWRGRWGRGIENYVKIVDEGTEKIVGLVRLYREQDG